MHKISGELLWGQYASPTLQFPAASPQMLSRVSSSKTLSCRMDPRCKKLNVVRKTITWLIPGDLSKQEK